MAHGYGNSAYVFVNRCCRLDVLSAGQEVHCFALSIEDGRKYGRRKFSVPELFGSQGSRTLGPRLFCKLAYSCTLLLIGRGALYVKGKRVKR